MILQVPVCVRWLFQAPAFRSCLRFTSVCFPSLPIWIWTSVPKPSGQRLRIRRLPGGHAGVVCCFPGPLTYPQVCVCARMCACVCVCVLPGGADVINHSVLRMSCRMLPGDQPKPNRLNPTRIRPSDCLVPSSRVPDFPSLPIDFILFGKTPALLSTNMEPD